MTPIITHGQRERISMHLDGVVRHIAGSQRRSGWIDSLCIASAAAQLLDCAVEWTPQHHLSEGTIATPCIWVK